MTLLLLLALLSPRVNVAPARPLIGDLVTITFEAPADSRISLAPSADYHVVKSEGNRVTMQLFRTGEVTLSGEVWNGSRRAKFANLVVKVQPVLKAADDGEPAPLSPPRELPRDTRSWWIVGGAAALAVVPWALLYFPKRRTRRGTVRRSTFLSDLAALEAMEPRRAWPLLADLARELLAERDPAFPRALTTSELMDRFRPTEPSLRETLEIVLSEGDYAKFSPFQSSAARLRTAIAGMRAMATPEAES